MPEEPGVPVPGPEAPDPDVEIPPPPESDAPDPSLNNNPPPHHADLTRYRPNRKTWRYVSNPGRPKYPPLDS